MIFDSKREMNGKLKWRSSAKPNIWRGIIGNRMLRRGIFLRGICRGICGS
jgi:hypothetical protein